MRTRPSESNVAVCKSRPVAIDAVALKAPVLGSYNSAEATTPTPTPPLPLSPPAMRTRPSESNVAVCLLRTVVIDPVELKAPGVGDWVGVRLSDDVEVRLGLGDTDRKSVVKGKSVDLGG